MAFINYLCPNCNGSLMYEQHDGKVGEDDYVICGCCGTKHYVRDLEKKHESSLSGASAYVGATASPVSYPDTAESALAYIENYFETYDWNDFMYTSAISVPAIDKVVDNILIKHGASPATWEMQFTAISTPLLKKLNELKNLEKKFFEEYVKSEDLAESFIYFDNYSKTVNNIVAATPSVLKKLNSAIKFYKKYHGSPAVIQQLTAQLETITEKLNAVTPVKDYKSLAGYPEAQRKKQAAISQKLSAKGIDAEAVYSQAVSNFNAGDNHAALGGFYTVAGYKDSYDYIVKLDDFVNFGIADGRFIKLGGNYFILRRQSTGILSLSNLQQTAGAQPVEDGNARFELHRIVNAKEEGAACVTGITKIFAHFGGDLIYLKNNASLCVFDSEAGSGENAETVIISGKAGDFDSNLNPSASDKVRYKIADNKLYLLQKLTAVVRVEEKKGCLSMFKKNKAQPELKVLTNNNFSLVSLDFASGEMRTVIPELIDVQVWLGEEIFYNKSIGGLEGEGFYAYNYKTGETKSVLDNDTEIVDVVNGKIIYFMCAPNDYNKDLYALDLATENNVLLERNVYDYYKTVEGKPYYFVGNYNCKTLYSIDLITLKKKEIRKNSSYFNNDAIERNGWLYFTVGLYPNAMLVKMSTDGEKYIVLCPFIKKLVTLKDGYVYYVDVNGKLRSVREDGTENREILDHVENFIEVAGDAIYLLRKEIVDEVNGSYVRANSLYKVNLSGEGLQKVAFNVSDAELNHRNEEEIYLYKTNKITYSISVPVDKDNYSTTYETYDIKSVLVYDISAQTFATVAEFGKPERNGSYTFKSGCLKKPVTKDVIVKEVPNKKTYRRTDKLSEGAVASQQRQQLETVQAASAGGASMTSSPAFSSTATKAATPRSYANGANYTMGGKILLSITLILFAVSNILTSIIHGGDREGIAVVIRSPFAALFGVMAIVCGILVAKKKFSFKDRAFLGAFVFMIFGLILCIAGAVVGF